MHDDNELLENYHASRVVLSIVTSPEGTFGRFLEPGRYVLRAREATL